MENPHHHGFSTSASNSQDVKDRPASQRETRCHLIIINQSASVGHVFLAYSVDGNDNRGEQNSHVRKWRSRAHESPESELLLPSDWP
jgi:hypothetical protein